MIDRIISPLDLALNTIFDMVEAFFNHSPYLLVGAFIILVFFLVSKLIQPTIVKLGEKSPLDNTLIYIMGSLGGFITTSIGVLIAAVVIFPDFSPSSLITGLGIGSVAVGFAFKDIFQNFFAGMVVLWQRPFVVGQQIRTQGMEGTVEDINIRATAIKTFDNERVIIPNGALLTNPIEVITAYKSRRTQLAVGISYKSSQEKARQIMESVLKDTQGVLAHPKPWVYLSNFGNSSVDFDVYYWSKPEQAETLRVANAVMSEIKARFDQEGIEIPFPQRTLHLESIHPNASHSIEDLIGHGQPVEN